MLCPKQSAAADKAMKKAERVLCKGTSCESEETVAQGGWKLGRNGRQSCVKIQWRPYSDTLPTIHHRFRYRALASKRSRRIAGGSSSVPLEILWGSSPAG